MVSDWAFNALSTSSSTEASDAATKWCFRPSGGSLMTIGVLLVVVVEAMVLVFGPISVY